MVHELERGIPQRAPTLEEFREESIRKLRQVGVDESTGRILTEEDYKRFGATLEKEYQRIYGPIEVDSIRSRNRERPRENKEELKTRIKNIKEQLGELMPRLEMMRDSKSRTFVDLLRADRNVLEDSLRELENLGDKPEKEREVEVTLRAVLEKARSTEDKVKILAVYENVPIFDEHKQEVETFKKSGGVPRLMAGYLEKIINGVEIKSNEMVVRGIKQDFIPREFALQFPARARNKEQIRIVVGEREDKLVLGKGKIGKDRLMQKIRDEKPDMAISIPTKDGGEFEMRVSPKNRFVEFTTETGRMLKIDSNSAIEEQLLASEAFRGALREFVDNNIKNSYLGEEEKITADVRRATRNIEAGIHALGETHNEDGTLKYSFMIDDDMLQRYREARTAG